MNSPTADEIFQEVRRSKPTGWRWFTPDMAQRVAITLTRIQAVGVLVNSSDDDTLTEGSLDRLAEDVRTNHGQVGGLATAVIGWVLWQLVQVAVIHAIKWAWSQRRGSV